MKHSMIFTALMILASASISQASTQKACLFGESSWEVIENMELESGTAGKIWYEGDRLDLSLPQRLNGLNAVEKEMILIAMKNSYSGAQTDAEAFADFSSADGYIQYFQHRSNNKHYAMVASYPGDNEFGVILDIKVEGRNNEVLAINGTAAGITDGDLEDCNVVN